jgi:ppGpp synthetase/RelA/SpoT-type nucleotidyltranferase
MRRDSEREFREKWEREIPAYKALGEYVRNKVKAILAEENTDFDASSFFKVPPTYRTKDVDSLVAKAFYRHKEYADPYRDITDKVGVRFVVLLTGDINTVKAAVEKHSDWTYSKDRDYELERENKPEFFTYASVHYVVRLRNPIEFNGVLLDRGMACEIQIRTLSQHAYSELTHDTTYKAKKEVAPLVKRLCARAMALIEATDECFMNACEEIKKAGESERLSLQALSDFYQKRIGLAPSPTRVTSLIMSALMPKFDEQELSKIYAFFAENPLFFQPITEKFQYSQLHRDPTILLVYYWITYRKWQLLDKWPLTRGELVPLGHDIGVAIPES